MTEINWVTLQNYQGRLYAEMAIDILEQNNIPCMLNPGNHPGMGFGTTLSGHNITVLVPEESYKEAVKLLEEIMDVK